MPLKETNTISRIYLLLNCLFNDKDYTVLLHFRLQTMAWLDNMNITWILE